MSSGGQSTIEPTLNGWTGGQYSVLRVSYALAAWVYAAGEWLGGEGGTTLERWGALGALTLVIVPLACGWLDRLAAAALAGLLLGHRFLMPTPEVIIAWPAFESLLLLHVFVAPAPYGALAAKGRSDPRGDWALPDRLHDLAWLALGLSHLLSGLLALRTLNDLAGAGPARLLPLAMSLLFLPLALWRSTRPLALLLGLSTLAFAPWAGSTLLAFVAHLACFSPAWLAPCRKGVELLFYDGQCGLCHRAIRFCLAEDSSGEVWRFASLQSPCFEAKVSVEIRATLPDSLVVLTRDGHVLTRSDALLRVLSRLGGLWRIASWAGRLIPRLLRDALYAVVARARHRLFSAPEGSCPLVTESLRARFVDLDGRD